MMPPNQPPPGGYGSPAQPYTPPGYPATGYGAPPFPNPQDRLGGWWLAIIYGSIVLGGCGAWIIVVVSSILYYVWRGQYPNKAKAINRHGWIAWLVSTALWAGLYIALRGR
jgi:hypothetical protein